MGLDMYLFKAKTPRDMGGKNPRTLEELRAFTAARETTAQKAQVFDELMTGDLFLEGDSYRYISAFQEVGYWRKANAIHRWFVENVQNGNDDCDYYPVTFDQLAALLDVCERVVNTVKIEKGTVINGQTCSADGEWEPNYEWGEIITNAEEIAELLPTAGGFFFGGTDYDGGYMDDVRSTFEIIWKIPAADSGENKGVTYFYHSSW